MDPDFIAAPKVPSQGMSRSAPGLQPMTRGHGGDNVESLLPIAESKTVGEARRSIRLVLIALVGLLSILLASAALDIEPTFVVLIAAGLWLIALLRLNPSWIVHLTLIVLFAAKTEGLPRGIRVLGIFIYFHEVLLTGAVVYAIWLARHNRTVVAALRSVQACWAAVAFACVVVIGLFIGFFRGYPAWDIQYDVRNVLAMMAFALVASVIVTIDDWRRYIKTFTAILVFSALLMIYASVTGLPLEGRTETAQLYTSGGRVLAGGSDAIRYITDTTHLAAAALLAGVAILLLRKAAFRRVVTVLGASFLISMLSFSRNTLAALAGTVVFVLIIAVFHRKFLRVLSRLAIAPLVAVIAFYTVLGIGATVGADDWIQTQRTGYQNRVLAGFDQANERADNSAQYREVENTYIKQAGSENPVLGGGFGTRYKPPRGKRGSFEAVWGTLYTHNAYNWIYVKTGLVGVLFFGLLIVACLSQALFRRRDTALIVVGACTLTGLSVTMLVAPLPIDGTGACVVGIVMGVCMGGEALRRVQGMRPIG